MYLDTFPHFGCILNTILLRFLLLLCFECMFKGTFLKIRIHFDCVHFEQGWCNLRENFGAYASSWSDLISKLHLRLMLLLERRCTSLRKVLLLKVFRKCTKFACLISTRKSTSTLQLFSPLDISTDDSRVSKWTILPLLIYNKSLLIS